MQASVLKLERMAVALVKTGKAADLRGQQRDVVRCQALRRGTLLGKDAEIVGSRRGEGGGLQPAWRHADHHFLGRERRRVL